MDRIWPKQLYVAKPYPIEQLLTKNEIKFFFSAFFFKPAKTIFSLRVRSFLFGLLFFWEFWKWRCTCVGILVRANQIQEFKFTSSLLLFWRSTHLASHWLIFSVRWRIISRREKKQFEKMSATKADWRAFFDGHIFISKTQYIKMEKIWHLELQFGNGRKELVRNNVSWR